MPDELLESDLTVKKISEITGVSIYSIKKIIKNRHWILDSKLNWLWIKTKQIF